MKKWSILLALILLVAIFPTFVSEQKHTEAATIQFIQAENEIILRDAPSKDAIKIATLQNHSEVIVHSTKNGWATIEQNGKNGYILATALTFEKPKQVNTLAQIVTTGLLPKVNTNYTYSPSFDGTTEKTYHASKNPYVENSVSLLESEFNGYTYIETSQNFTLGIAYSDVFFFSLDYPMKEQTPIYDTDYGIESNFTTEVYVESTSTTLITKAGTFENVVVIRYPNGSKLYIAKGFGIIRITDFEDTITTELISVNPQK